MDTSSLLFQEVPPSPLPVSTNWVAPGKNSALDQIREAGATEQKDEFYAFGFSFPLCLVLYYEYNLPLCIIKVFFLVPVSEKPVEANPFSPTAFDAHKVLRPRRGDGWAARAEEMTVATHSADLSATGPWWDSKPLKGPCCPGTMVLKGEVLLPRGYLAMIWRRF